MQRVKLTATFPEERYKGLTVRVSGEGSTLAIATTRAVRALFKHPDFRRKTPNWIFMQVSAFGMWEFPTPRWD